MENVHKPNGVMKWLVGVLTAIVLILAGGLATSYNDHLREFNALRDRVGKLESDLNANRAERVNQVRELQRRVLRNEDQIEAIHERIRKLQ